MLEVFVSPYYHRKKIAKDPSITAPNLVLWDNRVFNPRLMSLQKRLLGKTTHISDNHVLCVSLRGPSDTENRPSPLFSADTGPLTPLLSAHWLSTLAPFEPRTQTQDRTVGRVMRLRLSDSQTHTHICSKSHKPQWFNVHTQAREQS